MCFAGVTQPTVSVGEIPRPTGGRRRDAARVADGGPGGRPVRRARGIQCRGASAHRPRTYRPRDAARLHRWRRRPRSCPRDAHLPAPLRRPARRLADRPARRGPAAAHRHDGRGDRRARAARGVRALHRPARLTHRRSDPGAPAVRHAGVAGAAGRVPAAGRHPHPAALSGGAGGADLARRAWLPRRRGGHPHRASLSQPPSRADRRAEPTKEKDPGAVAAGVLSRAGHFPRIALRSTRARVGSTPLGIGGFMPPRDFSRLLTTEVSSLVSTGRIRVSRLETFLIGTWPSPSPTTQSCTGTPGATRATFFSSCLSSLVTRGVGPSPMSTMPGRPSARKTIAASTMSLGRVPRAPSIATGSWVAYQPRLPSPVRVAPAAPGWPSSARYIAVLPRRFITTTAASSAAAIAMITLYQSQNPPKKAPMPMTTAAARTAAPPIHHPILRSSWWMAV